MICQTCHRRRAHARGLCKTCYSRDLRKRHRIKRPVCLGCGKQFETSRKDAKTCSPKCRNRLHRKTAGRGALRIGKDVAGIARGQTEAAPTTSMSGLRTSLTEAAPQNPPARQPFSKMSAVELGAFTLDELQAMRREELAAINDARNTAPRSLSVHLSPEFERRFDERETERVMRENKRRGMSLLQRSYAKIRGSY